MKIFFTLLFSVANLIGYTQDAVFEWAKRMGASNYETAIAIAVDANGNVYTTGAFGTTTDFDPGPGVFNLTSQGANDIFVSKLDAAGNFVWAVSMGSTTSESGRSIAVDALGNVYTTGWFLGTPDFDPGAGTYNLTSTGGLDIFVSKLDASGNFVWAMSMGNATTSGYDNGESIKLDPAGNVYVTGTMVGTVDFDPGPGTYNLTAVGGMDIFVLKLNTAGGFVWARSIGGTNTDEGFEIALDAAGNVYTTGYYFGTADFDPGAGVNNFTSAGSYDIFILKLDPSGDLIWARSLGGPSDDRGFSLAVDGSGNVYTTGHYVGTADFDPGIGTQNMTSTGGTIDAFISKLNSAGEFVWAKSISGTVGDWAESLVLDATGVYITGRFTGTSDFDPGPGTHSVTSAGSLDLYVAKLTTAGDFSWAKIFGSTGDDRGYSIAVDALNNVHFTGDFFLTVDFDPGPGTANLTSAGQADIMVVKLGQTGLLPIQLGSLSGVYKNKQVELNWNSYDDDDAESYEVLHSKDGINFTFIGQVAPRRNSGESTYRFIHFAYSTGKNYYRILAKEYNGKQHYSNIIVVVIKANHITLLKNPIQDQLRIQFQAEKNDNMILHLYDGGGKTIWRSSLPVTRGLNQAQWNVSHLPAGYYVLEVLSTGTREAMMIIKK